MTCPRILVAGIGNTFLGDDGFGVEVVRRLADRPLAEGMRVVDFGIRGFDLACALLDGYDTVILVDTTRRGGRPGTLYVIEPDPDEPGAPGAAPAWAPVQVFRLAGARGGRLRRFRLVGWEPATFGREGGEVGLSEPVRAAVGGAVEIIEALVTDLAGGRSGGR